MEIEPNGQEDTIPSERRKILAKEHFLEGHRQKWAGIFVSLGILVMILTSYGVIKDPAPFLGYFTGIGVSFILGASGSEIMKAYKVESRVETTVVDDKAQDAAIAAAKMELPIDKEIKENIKEEGIDAPLAKPFSAAATEEGDNNVYDFIGEKTQNSPNN